jgi:uncharacterized OB-fold protein
VCGAWQWYPYEFIRCHADASLVWKPVTGKGEVFTFTRVHRSFLPNAPAKAPSYIAALVELDEAPGARIPTVLINTEDRQPFVGMRVRLNPQRRSTYTLPAFEPDTSA